MIFTPTLKRKRTHPKQSTQDPLPQCSPGEEARGVFNGFSVHVFDPEAIRMLYDSGCFGKGSKSRSCPEFLKQSTSSGNREEAVTESLAFDLEEAFFLVHFLKVLKIEDFNGAQLAPEELMNQFSQIKPNFIDTLVAYIYLRSKNWIVKSGTKFGGDFLIYKKGLRYYHASFIVLVNRGEKRSPTDVKGLQRIAETSNKDLLFLEITPPKDGEENLENLNKFTVSENIVKRFNYNTFVQKK